GVPYESRWAPCSQVHGPGQGQFPEGSIRPRGYMAPDARRSFARGNVGGMERRCQHYVGVPGAMQRSSRCFAEPGPHQTPASTTAPAQQHTSSRKIFAEHRQTAARLLPRGLVLDDVPVLREHAILHAHDIGDDPRRWQAEAAEPPMENDEVAGRRRNVVLVAQRRGQGLDQAKQPVAAGRNMRAVLDVTRRSEALGGSVVALVEKRIKRVKDGLDIAVSLVVSVGAAMAILLLRQGRALRCSGQTADDRGAAGEFDPIAVRIEDHRYPRHVSERYRCKTFADAPMLRSSACVPTANRTTNPSAARKHPKVSRPRSRLVPAA
ncbi:MAG: hypothetical protein QOJ84_168, partial [Bradyrhizobium sp.]|nr:hypothetical protein [Bradyrhizobium sp.]